MSYGGSCFRSYIYHFLSTDPIVPDFTYPPSLHKYTYGLNNPVKYNDPTGFCGADSVRNIGMQEQRRLTKECETLRDFLESSYILEIGGQWKLNEMEILALSLQDIQSAFGSLDAFHDAFGWTWVTRYREPGRAEVSWPPNGVQLRNSPFSYNKDVTRWVIIHEFGHRWDARSWLFRSAAFEAHFGDNTTGLGCFSIGEVICSGVFPNHCSYQLDSSNPVVSRYAKTDRRENFAETFAAAVFQGKWANVTGGNSAHNIYTNALVTAADRIDYMRNQIQFVGQIR